MITLLQTVFDKIGKLLAPCFAHIVIVKLMDLFFFKFFLNLCSL